MPSGFLHDERTARSSDEWYTPPEIFEALGVEFDLDPAAPPGGVPWVPARRYFCARDDGLVQPWEGLAWVNPPYGRHTGLWLDRLASHGAGMALVFARTDTAWFQRAARSATALCFVAGRLRFVRPDGSRARAGAGAGSLLIAYGLPCALALAHAGLGPVFPVTDSGERQNGGCPLAVLRGRKQGGDEGLAPAQVSGEIMSRKFHIVATPKDPPDLDRFVAALLAMAMARLDEERRQAAKDRDDGEPEGSDG